MTQVQRSTGHATTDPRAPPIVEATNVVTMEDGVAQPLSATGATHRKCGHRLRAAAGFHERAEKLNGRMACSASIALLATANFALGGEASNPRPASASLKRLNGTVSDPAVTP